MHLGRHMCLPRETGICICCNEDLSLWQGYTFEVVMYPVPQFFPWALGVQTCYSRQYHVDNFSADDFCHFVRENKMYSHLLLVPPHSSLMLHFLLKQTRVLLNEVSLESPKCPLVSHITLSWVSCPSTVSSGTASAHGKCSVQHRLFESIIFNSDYFLLNHP